LILIEGNRDLASQYAGKIMEINWQIKDPSQPYDKWRLRELDFWFGATATGTVRDDSQAQPAPANEARKRARSRQTAGA
jgi:hypothetical protein